MLEAHADTTPARGGGFDRLSRRDFDRLSRFIQDYSGIKMPPSKITMVEGRLRRRIRATGAAGVTEYCRMLFDQGGLESEAIHLIDAVTTNKTEFFREPEHFRILTDLVLPDLLGSGRRASQVPIKVWSAASSTGAEAYTVAMVLSEYAQGTPGMRFDIVGTDICTEVLAAAVLGIYPEAMAEAIPSHLRARFVRRGRGASKGLARLAPELRAMVHFGRLNLMAESYPMPPDFDVIFCRNILIYFDKPTQQAVLSRLCSHLRPGGHLFLGHSESLAGFGLPLRAVAATVFCRV